LTLAQVYAALAYYHANRDQVEAELAADEAEADTIEQEYLRTKKPPDEDPTLRGRGRYGSPFGT